ncbi:DJ-1/PfpI family protein [Ekhidna sp.]|uniref:DJ-1/PfpI family protein n=1 Tax=Ekhidna sp. TaxID=2608089 RepID=UPI003296EDB4
MKKTLKTMKKTLFAVLVCFIFQLSAQIPKAQKYICPPCGSQCDEEVHDKPGVCLHCNMVLIRKDLSKTIAFYLQDGVEVLDFAGPMEVFSYAGYDVFTVSKDKAPIKSQGILTVTPDYSIADAPDADILAFFGGNARAAFTDESVIKWIKKQEDVQFHFSVCTGAFVLAEAGILDGKTATTFHNALDGLENSYPMVDVRKDVRFVDNGNVITTAGISAGIDGALHLVAKLQGLNAAKRTAYYMEYDNWVPGDGLILSEDNPYQIQKINLEEFTGSYESKDPNEIVLEVVDGDLQAKIDGVSYPIYHETGDLFTDVGNEPIYFEREAGALIGYRLEPAGQLFKKLN